MKPLTDFSMSELVAEHNRLAAILGTKPTNRFADRKSGIRRVEALLAQHRPVPKLTWAQANNYGCTKAQQPMHALRLTPKQRKAFHAEVCAVYAKEGTDGVMLKWGNKVSHRILAGHIRIARTKVTHE